jgi:flagellum-specific ATP synthase
VATAAAEYFRDQGLDVMLLFDSVTRFARAQREIGLASGEPPATRGYTPSMFDSMPKLLERCGTSDRGTITGFYTILVDGDDMDEPVSDTVRGILDGHIVLSRSLAERYHYPAIDVLRSVSRLSPSVSGRETRKAEGVLRRLMADYAGVEDYLNVGAYKQGSNPRIDAAIENREAIENFLSQNVDEKSSLAETLKMMADISGVESPEDEAKTYSKEREPPAFFPADNEEDEAEAGTEPAGGETEAAALPAEEAEDLPLADFN